MHLNWERNKMCVSDICDLIGLTPMVKLKRIPKDYGINASILCKLERFNPSGSLKDRILYHIIKSAEMSGKLKPGMHLIEGTTGNTGIATAWIGAVLGYPVTIVMPSGMSEERKRLMELLGAEIVYTPGGESDVDITLKKVEEIVKSNPGKYFWVRQFSNPDNVEAHYYTTAREIWEQTHGGRIDAIVASQGTGGTITGIAYFFKGKRPEVKIYTMEPAECPIISKGKWGSHRIEGIGDGFIPDNLHLEKIDGIVVVSSDEAINMAKELARKEGILCGISSGGNVVAAIKIAQKYPDMQNIVTIINDNIDRYFSTKIFGEEKELEVPQREDTTIKEADKNKLEALKEKGHILEIIE